MVSILAPWAKYFRIIKTPQIDLNFITAQPISIQYNLTCRIANVIRNIIRKTVTVDLLMLSIWSVIFLLSLSLDNLKLVLLSQNTFLDFFWTRGWQIMMIIILLSTCLSPPSGGSLLQTPIPSHRVYRVQFQYNFYPAFNSPCAVGSIKYG